MFTIAWYLVCWRLFAVHTSAVSQDQPRHPRRQTCSNNNMPPAPMKHEDGHDYASVCMFEVRAHIVNSISITGLGSQAGMHK